MAYDKVLYLKKGLVTERDLCEMVAQKLTVESH